MTSMRTHFAAVSYPPAIPFGRSREMSKRRALRIIFPDCSYNEALPLTGLVALHERREFLCDKLFNSILSNPLHKL